jgi:amino acid adenylation domain-containing protein
MREMQSQLTVVEKEQLLKLAKAFGFQSKTTSLQPITPAERSGSLPLSFAQQRMWFLAQQMQGVSRANHVCLSVRLTGRLDRWALRQALDRIVARHEALRTTFEEINGDPRQWIIPADESRFRLVEEDLCEAMDPQNELDHLVKQEFFTSFDLKNDPLIRGRLIREGEESHVLLITMHHIVSDGLSMGVLIKELSVLYRAYMRGEEDPLPELKIQYGDYAIWQRKWMEGDALREHTKYWEETLAGAPPLLELPTDYARPAVQDYTGGWVGFDLDEKLTRGLRELSKRHGMTLYMTLLAGWGALLARLSGQDDIVIGTPVANRDRVEIEGLIGFFVNTLALRLDISGSPKVDEFLERVKRQSLAAQQHQDMPFEQVVEIARPVRTLAHSPLLQTGFSWQNAAVGEIAFEGLMVSYLHTAIHRVAKLDLTLLLQDAGMRIVGGLEYATALFERLTVERFTEYFRALLEAMVADSTQVVGRLSILTDIERDRILREWNATEIEYSEKRCIHELFEEQVKRTPDAVAVVFEEASLSYGELNRQANRLAHYLRGIGVGPEARVGICAERSLDIVVGLLGVLKAGGAYVPLDPAYPVERLQYMVEDSKPVVVLTQGEHRGAFGALNEEMPVVDLSAGQWQEQPEWNPDRSGVGLSPENVAYVIYTSGSTGMAKGVMVEHRHLSNYVAAIGEKLGLKEGWSYGLVSTFAADLGNTALFPSLARGGKLHVIPARETTDSDRFDRYCSEQGIDCLKITPSHFQALLGEGGQADRIPRRRLVFGGEALSRELVATVRGLRAECHIYNHYGPTECTVGALSEEMAQGSALAHKRAMPLGRPLGNIKVYILDEDLNLAPTGAVGEIYIGGAGVARGYDNRAELTAERFVGDPFAGDEGARMYKTGDMGRWLGDGTIEFLGRNDFQVKIRGYRIELGEIEARLREHEAVRDAVVIAREDTAVDKRLVAYFTCPQGSDTRIEVEELRRHVAAKLPEYMTPVVYAQLDELPLTPNGKLDRKALPAPNDTASLSRQYEAPQGKVETKLAMIWAEVLKVEQVGRHDNFFKLGGNSLLVIRVITRLRQAGLHVDVRSLFAIPVLSELAVAIGSQSDLFEVPPNRILEISKQREILKGIEVRI